ncbi:MAG TPA: HAD-IIIA family hydrolase [Polyangiaceae bacterium]|nr:HAD-IIIA family hydrolase [Polyangiaceae bacterium]
MNPCVILDRDGTLIDVVRDEETGTVNVAFHPSQLVLLPGVVSGLQSLVAHGFKLGIATNQPGPAKGQFSRHAVQRTNDALVAMLRAEGIPIAAVAACLHHPTGAPDGDRELITDCNCRKPKPGLLHALDESMHILRAESWMIGDSRADLEAAHAFGVRSALVFSTQRCELCPLRAGPSGAPDVVAPRFDDVVARLLSG